MEPDKLLETAHGLESTMDQLTDLLTAESEGVYTRSTADMARFRDDKARLFADYVTGLQTLHDAHNGQPVPLPAATKAALRTKHPLLTAAMKRNERALAVALEASRRVVGMIVDAVKEQRSTNTGSGYGISRSGTVTGHGDGSAGSAQAITLDTRL